MHLAGCFSNSGRGAIAAENKVSTAESEKAQLDFASANWTVAIGGLRRRRIKRIRKECGNCSALEHGIDARSLGHHLGDVFRAIGFGRGFDVRTCHQCERHNAKLSRSAVG